MEHAKAYAHAQQVARALQPYCEKIHIAGSIRRQKPDVKDMEIVCLPRTAPVGAVGLFDLATPMLEAVPEFRKVVLGLGEVLKGETTGRYMQIQLTEIKLDLFMPEADDFYRQYAIRTGSAEFAARKIASGWKKIGWCGSDKGLRKIEDCEHKSGKWLCRNPNAEKPPVWQSEREFFDWLQIPWIKPEQRLQ